MSDDAEEPDFLSIRCESCQAKLRIRAKLSGKEGTCPECGARFIVPVRPVVDIELPEPESDFAEDESGGYRIAGNLNFEGDDQPPPLPPELMAPVPIAGYLDQMGQVRQEKKSKPPEYAFFSRVFEFPWYSEVWPRWMWLVLGGTMASMIPMLAIAFMGGVSGYAGVGVAFFAMPQIWITIWTGSYAAACGMQIFEDTAAGGDHIASWPEPNWREWMWPLMYMGYVAFMVFALAYGVGKALGGSNQTSLMLLVGAELMLFPVCLLSVLETNHLALLFSPRVLWSMVQKPLGWLQFYLLTGGLFALWIGSIWLGFIVHPLLVILVCGFMYASVTLIWFRLLGRLAWVISYPRTRKRQRTKQDQVATVPLK